jgi:general secretion pathway protein K
MRRDEEKGVALLTMLLIVAVMSALAVAVLDDIRFAIRRTTNAELTGQARWYALGAETLARQQLARLAMASPDRTPVGDEVLGVWRAFPVEGGVINAKLDDAGNCFNLNSVVEGAPEYWLRRETGLRQYRALLTELGFAPREALSLSEALADWIDTDGGRNTAGAEDETYLDEPAPYRTSGALLAEVSELRAIRGYEPEIYDLVRPFVCALPTAELSPLNVNTLTPEQAVLLTVLTDRAITLETARQLIAGRPADGWANTTDFWSSPALNRAIPTDAALAQVSVRTRFFGLTAQVDYAGGEAYMTALLEQNGERVTTRARRWTADE